MSIREKYEELIWFIIKRLFGLVANREAPYMGPIELFMELMAKKTDPVVLETGTCRSIPERSTMHKDWVPHAHEFIGTDIQEGLDVDIVSDIHKLSAVFGENRFDAVISTSTFEHIQYPWLAVIEICKVLKPGGLVFIHTHQTYPLHAYPNDYWRFSADALKTLFNEEVGFKTLDSGHQFHSYILSTPEPTPSIANSYLNAILLAEKIRHPKDDPWGSLVSIDSK